MGSYSEGRQRIRGFSREKHFQEHCWHENIQNLSSLPFVKFILLDHVVHSIICTIVHHFNERILYSRGGRMKNESSCRLGMHAPHTSAIKRSLLDENDSHRGWKKGKARKVFRGDRTKNCSTRILYYHVSGTLWWFFFFFPFASCSLSCNLVHPVHLLYDSEATIPCWSLGG